MKLHWSPRSPFVRKVMIVAHETGLVERLTCVRTVAAMKVPNPALLPDNPLCKIPALVLDDGSPLYDSRVICEYLDTLHARAKLFPLAGPARFVALRRQALGDGFLDFLLLWRHERERPQPSRELLDAFAVKFNAVLSALDQEVAGLATTAFGIGHIAIFCGLSYLDFRFRDLDWRPAHQEVAAWLAVFEKRASAQATAVLED
jgi:glutathione S-transferase